MDVARAIRAEVGILTYLSVPFGRSRRLDEREAMGWLTWNDGMYENELACVCSIKMGTTRECPSKVSTHILKRAHP